VLNTPYAPPYGGEIEELSWHEGGWRGKDLWFIRESPWPPLRLLRCAWPAAVDDGWCPVAWTIVERMSPAVAMLLIVAGPEVEISPLMPAQQFICGPAEVELAIIRVQRVDLVPQGDDPIRPGVLLDADIAVHALTLQSPPRSGASRSTVALLSQDTARIRWLPDGAVCTHAKGDWELRVKVSPYKRGAFSLECEPDPAAPAILAQSAFMGWIVKWGTVDVEMIQRSTMFPILWDPVEILLTGRAATDYSQISAKLGTLKSHLTVPPSGLDISLGENFSDVDPTYSYPAWQTTLVNTVIFTYELIPFIGPVFELSHLAYAAGTGHTLAGEKVTEEDLFFMGAYAVISIASMGAGAAPVKGIRLAGEAAEVAATLFVMAAQQQVQ
jgi:hypothetical protein